MATVVINWNLNIPRVEVHPQTHRFLNRFLPRPQPHGLFRMEAKLLKFLAFGDEIERVLSQHALQRFEVYADASVSRTQRHHRPSSAVSDGDGRQRCTPPRTLDEGKRGRTLFASADLQSGQISLSVRHQGLAEQPPSAQVFVAPFFGGERRHLIGVCQRDVGERVSVDWTCKEADAGHG